MKLKYTILYVSDVKTTIDFYAKAFGLKPSMIHESGNYAELQTGETKLAFSSLALMSELGKNPSSPNEQNPSFEIAFETNDVAVQLKQAITAGAKLVQNAEKMPWGQTTSYVTDINGFLIEICSPVQ